jgi:phospholipase C
MKCMHRYAAAVAAIACPVQPALAASSLPLVTTQPDLPADVAPYFVADTDSRWTGSEWSADGIAALRQKIKYVFVIFDENRSFDHEYGTLPGVNGLYSDGKNPRSPPDTPGFTESYLDTNTGETVSVQPFRVGPEQNSTIKDSTDHSHTGLAAKLDVQNGVARMDKFAEVEWRKYARAGGAAREAMGKQFARLVMAHIDCDTIPFFWRYASRFTIFDNIFATEDTPSTPNAVAMIAGQSGETQWVKHPSETQDATQDGFTGPISGTINGKTYSGTAPRKVRRWSRILSRGGARSSITRSPVVSLPGRRERNGITQDSCNLRPQRSGLQNDARAGLKLIREHGRLD